MNDTSNESVVAILRIMNQEIAQLESKLKVYSIVGLTDTECHEAAQLLDSEIVYSNRRNKEQMMQDLLSSLCLVENTASKFKDIVLQRSQDEATPNSPKRSPRQ
jgi:hypothetical protein